MLNFIKNQYIKLCLFLASFILLLIVNFNYFLPFNSTHSILYFSYSHYAPLLFFISISFISVVLSKIWSRYFFIKSAIIYLLYLLGSYIIECSRNVNVLKYNIFSFKANDFFQVNFLLFLFSIFLIAFIYHYVISIYCPIFENRLIKISEYKEYYSILFHSFMLIGFCLTDSKIYKILPETSYLRDLFTDGLIKNQFSYLMELDKFIILLIIILFPFVFCSIIGIDQLYRNRPKFGAALVCSSFFAITFNYTIQNSIRTDVTILGRNLFPGATAFQVLVFFALFLLIYCLFNEFLLSTLLSVFLIIGISIASYLKFQYRQEPILPSDLSWLMHPGIMFDSLGPQSYFYVFLIVAVFLGLYLSCRKIILYGRVLENYYLRGIVIISIFSFFIGIYSVFKQRRDGKVDDSIPVIGILNNQHDISWFGNTTNAQIKSLSYVWFSHLTSEVMIKPKDYSKSSIQKIEEKYKKVAGDINLTRKENINEQTVIYVLSESFSDPSRIEDVKVSSNPIPKIQEIKKRTTSGLMKSDGYGGGTANMEFQTLTGLPMYNLSPSISILYTQVAPVMNYFPSISNSFNSNNRIVIHIASPSNYSRNIIYGNLDFAKFIHYGNKGKEGYNIGGNYSDESTYQLVLKNMNKDSQFFSVMTMQNHTPWNEPNPIDMNASYPGFSDNANKQLSAYIRMLYHTDNATQDFLEKLSKIDKKITVVFYGDHLPGLYPESAFKNYPEGQYQTDYFIWSNFDAPKLDYPLVNSSDFSAMVFEQTNSKVSPYYALLTEVLKKASVDKKALEGEALEIAEDLKMVEYDLISGKGYLSQDFFEVPSAKN